MSAVAELAVPRAEAIARLNDQLRKSASGGTIMVTKGVLAISGYNSPELAEALAAYDAFDADNDPHGERDFGDMTLWGEEMFWKIDYYDVDLKFGSDDPADPDKTKRVLTVMLTNEWCAAWSIVLQSQLLRHIRNGPAVSPAGEA